MRLWLLTVLVLSVANVSQSQSILDNVMNFFNRLNPFRDQQQQQSSRPRPTAPVFRPRPAPATRAPAPSPVAPAAPPPSPPPGFSFGRLRLEPIATPGRGNHNFEGKTYLLSWKEGQT